MNSIKIGTRKSVLAQVQTRIVAEKIRQTAPDVKIEIIPMSTEGDKRLDKNLSSFGGKGVFTKELENALLDGSIHMAVHSAKDMPVEFPAGLKLGAVVERAECEDMVVTMHGLPLREMKPGSVIGTGSLRRKLQLKRLNPEIRIKDIRGNVQTRLQKLEKGDYDGIILARAGIARLYRDLQERQKDFYDRFHYEILEIDDCLPAAGQGILAVEVSEAALECPWFAELCEKLNDADAGKMLLAERSFLRHIGGGCHAPVGAWSRVEGTEFRIRGSFAADGKSMKYAEVSGGSSDGEALGKALAEILLNNQ